jgi:hypothetical protein
MSRLNQKLEQKNVKPTHYVTLVGDILPNKSWSMPDELRVDGSNPRTDTGIIQLEIDGEPLIISRSGVNIGVDAEKVTKIVDALEDLGMTNDFSILETGRNDGTEPEHYTREDYIILQSKIAPSPYLTKFLPNLTKKYPS